VPVQSSHPVRPATPPPAPEAGQSIQRLVYTKAGIKLTASIDRLF
jgi:hypothetical protein